MYVSLPPHPLTFLLLLTECEVVNLISKMGDKHPSDRLIEAWFPEGREERYLKKCECVNGTTLGISSVIRVG